MNHTIAKYGRSHLIYQLMLFIISDKLYSNIVFFSCAIVVNL